MLSALGSGERAVFVSVVGGFELVREGGLQPCRANRVINMRDVWILFNMIEESDCELELKNEGLRETSRGEPAGSTWMVLRLGCPKPGTRAVAV